MVFTVIITHEDNGQVCAHHIEAEDGQSALLACAKEHGGTLVVCIAGACREATHSSEESEKGTLTFPGEGLVDAESYIETFKEA